MLILDLTFMATKVPHGYWKVFQYSRFVDLKDIGKVEVILLTFKTLKSVKILHCCQRKVVHF